MNHLKEICKNCGYTYGAHSAEGLSCPATEGGIDFAQGPNTKFKPTGGLLMKKENKWEQKDTDDNNIKSN